MPLFALPSWKTYANGDDVRALVQDGNTIWAGTQGGGLIRWNPEKEMYVNQPMSQSATARPRATASMAS